MEAFFNDSDQIIESFCSEEPYYLYSFGLPDGKVELSFSKYHPIDTIINGLQGLLYGGGCKSWRINILEKRQDFIIDQVKLIISCFNFKSAFLATFLVLSKIQNTVNVRRLQPRELIDPQNYLETRLISAKCVLKKIK